MIVSFDNKGGFDNVDKWLKKVSDPSTIRATLTTIGSLGEQRLKDNTPKDTGETASGWKSEIESSGNIHDLVWYNTAHPESRVSVARLIDSGHGTGTGGYVPPRPFVKRSMKSVYKSADVKIEEGLR